MGEPSSLAKFLIIAGAGLIVVGVIVLVLSKFISIGKLPGDIYVQKENMSFYFPIVSCILISIVLSVIMNLFRH